MDTSKGHSAGSRVVVGVGWFSALVAIYLFCMGPTCRCFPEAAELIYAPMSPVADWPVFGPAMRRWVWIWGVDVGEEDIILDKKQ
jgi:hypothetical protein